MEDCCGAGTKWNADLEYCVVDPKSSGFDGSQPPTTAIPTLTEVVWNAPVVRVTAATPVPSTILVWDVAFLCKKASTRYTLMHYAHTMMKDKVEESASTVYEY